MALKGLEGKPKQTKPPGKPSPKRLLWNIALAPDRGGNPRDVGDDKGLGQQAIPGQTYGCLQTVDCFVRLVTGLFTHILEIMLSLFLFFESLP